MEKIVITLENLKHIRGDVNKKIAAHCRALGVRVIDADVQVICAAEPGRTWIKKPGQTACTAYE